MPRKRSIRVEIVPLNGTFALKVQEGPIYFMVHLPDEELDNIRDQIDQHRPRKV